ncbi:MAG: hypothetical protein ACYDAY_10515 [Candidatus Dormibacteria bacterium]
MPQATLVFFDGEVSECELAAYGFTSNALQVSFARAGNTVAATVGLGGIKYVHYEGPPPGSPAGKLERRVAIHFNDGEVVRAYAGPELDRSAYGVLMEVEDPDREARQCVAIPFVSIKGIFEIREWDGRVARFQESLEQLDPGAPVVARAHRPARLSDRLRDQGAPEAD